MSFMSIDPANLASQYTQIERAKKDSLLSAKTTAFNAQLNAIKKLESQLKSFVTQLGNAKKNQGLLSNTATSSNDSTLKATASNKAVAGEYEIFVQQLAQNHQLALSFAPEATLPADGDFTVAFAGGSLTVDLANLPANASLTDLVNAINNHADNPANSGVRATLLRSNGETFLMISSEKTGADQTVSLNFNAGGSDGTVLQTALAGQQVLKQAQDAQLRIGADSALTISSATNTLTNVIEGVTLELVKAQSAGDNPIRLQIAQDQGAAKDNIKKIVDDFNALHSLLSSDGSLKNDSTARGIQNLLRSSVQGEFAGKSLYSVGLEFDRNGKLTINNSRLEKALAEDPEQLEAMLSGENGLLSKMTTALEPYSKSFGIMSKKQQTVQASLEVVNRQKARHDLAMEQVYKRYVLQFTQMQVTIAQLQSSMNSFG